MERQEFQKKLVDLGALAREKGSRLTMQEVQGFFADMTLTEEQFDLIYAYLASRQVVVEGYVKTAEPEEKRERKEEVALTPEEVHFLESYKEELSETEALSEAELERLAREILETEEEDRRALAKAQLMEQLLWKVVMMAREFCGRGTFFGDLVQEGNIGLLLALESLDQCPEDKTFLAYLRGEIRTAIAQAAEENETETQAGNLLADRLNELSDSIKKLSDELERAISVEELSAYMDLPVEEIEDLLKLAGEAQDGAEEPAKEQ